MITMVFGKYLMRCTTNMTLVEFFNTECSRLHDDDDELVAFVIEVLKNMLT